MNNLDMQSQLINIYKKFNKSDKVTELTLSTQLSYLDINLSVPIVSFVSVN